MSKQEPMSNGQIAYTVGYFLALGMTLGKYLPLATSWFESLLAVLMSIVMSLLSWLSVGIYFIGALTNG